MVKHTINTSTPDEYIEKLVTINRVTKVVKGGRRISFAVLMIVGDGKGRVSFGQGKAKEVPDAIRKAVEQAKKTLRRVPLRSNRTLQHDLKGHFGANRVLIRAADSGTGIIAGGPMRSIFECLGIQDVVSKSYGSSNPYNMVKATFDALSTATNPRNVAARRGIKVSNIMYYRRIVQEGYKNVKNQSQTNSQHDSKKQVAKTTS